MSAPNQETEYRIAKLQLRPGDVLVVKFNEHLTQEMAIRARDHFRELAPDVTVLVIDKGTDLSVLTAAEIQSRV